MKKTIKSWLTAISATTALAAVSVTAFAEDAQAATDSQANGGNAGTWYPLIMIGVFILIGYFMIIRPEKKRKKEAADMRDSLKPGDRISTIGGIVGTVESVTDEEIVLTNGLVLKRWALRSIETPTDSSPAATYYEDEEDAENAGEKETKSESTDSKEKNN